MDIDTILSNDSRQWRIAENKKVTFGRTDDIRLQKHIADNFWFLYKLEPINHRFRPEAGFILSVTVPDK